jgi:hypothetical protein
MKRRHSTMDSLSILGSRNDALKHKFLLLVPPRLDTPRSLPASNTRVSPAFV